MYMGEEDQISYLANAIFAAHADGVASPRAATALEEIRQSIGAKKNTYKVARKRALSGAYSPTKIGNFAAEVSNLADMLYVCAIDQEISDTKKQIISQFSKSTSLTEEQISSLTKEVFARISQKQISITCPACKTTVNADAKFCPKCGASLVATPSNAEFDIPATGYAIEFCESGSASFPSALKFAQGAASFSSCLRNKKTWYLASWPADAVEKVVQLADLLSGIRNKRCYLNGQESEWYELFGFMWCASKRSQAYRPAEYCFGKADNRLNPWGCIQARMDWTEWANWFSYGRFEKQGLVDTSYAWVFDKTRIKHELMTNLHRVRYCPHLRMRLVEAVLRLIPERVAMTENGPWKYRRANGEIPGSIKIVEVKKSGDLEFRDEYFANGVRPRGLQPLSEILQKAFAEVGITDVQYNEIVN
jgi:hypothetical protein